MHRRHGPAAMFLGSVASVSLGFAVAVEPWTLFGVLLVICLGIVMWEPALAVPVSLSAFALFSHVSPAQLSIALLVVAMAALTSSITLRSAALQTRTYAFGLTLLLVLGLQLTLFSVSSSVGARVAAIVAGAALAIVVYQRGQEDIDRVRRAFAATVVLVLSQAVLGLAQALTESLLLPGFLFSHSTLAAASDLPGFFRAVGTFAHPNAMGIVLALTLPVAIWLWQESSPAKRSAWAVGIAVIAAAALATLSRSAVLALLGAAGALAIGLPGAGRWRRLLAFATLASLITFSQFLGPFARLSGGSAVAARDSGSNEARLANMQAAMLAWQDERWLGHGLGSGARLGYRYGGYRDLGAHNTYLDVLAGGGIVLAVILVIGAGLYWLPTMRVLRRRGNALFALPIVLAVTGMFESLLQTGFVVLVGALTGLMVLMAKPQAQHSKGARGGRC